MSLECRHKGRRVVGERGKRGESKSELGKSNRGLTRV